MPPAGPAPARVLAPGVGPGADDPPLAQLVGVPWLAGSRSGGASLADAVPAEAPQALARDATPACAPLPAGSAEAAAATPAGTAAPLCSPLPLPAASAPAAAPAAVRAALPAVTALSASPAA